MMRIAYVNADCGIPVFGDKGASVHIQEMVRAIRNARSEYDVQPGRRIEALFSAGRHLSLVQEQLPILTSLAQLDTQRFTLAESLEIPEKSVTLVAGGVTIGLPLAGLVDLEAERGRLRQQLANAQKQVAANAARLDNPGFVDNAPDHVIEATRRRLAEWRSKQEQIEERLQALED